MYPDFQATSLVQELPAGEWAEIEFLDAAGVMARRFGAVLARAKSVRHGGRPVFIKLLRPPQEGATDSALSLLNPERLKRLSLKLNEIRAAASTIPAVPIIEQRFLPSGALLIAMEPVTDLAKLIEDEKANSHMAVSLLEHLAPPSPKSELYWHHFDICPKNVGVLPNGQWKLIDLESVYIGQDRQCIISQPYWKQMRAPENIAEQVLSEIDRNRNAISIGTAHQKYCYELLLAAAECSANRPYDFPDGIRRVTVGGLSTWIERSFIDQLVPVGSFWEKQFVAKLREGSIPDISTIASQLKSLLFDKPPSSTPRVIESNFVKTSTAHVASFSDSGVPAISDQQIRSYSQLLRSDKLSKAEIANYQNLLRERLSKIPQERYIWDELLLIYISFLKAPSDALSICKDAMEYFPQDPEFMRWQRIIRNWSMSK